jgi:4-amino-4-deoxy-L-arabinose transferase-like glycosyltransferase
VIKPWHWRVLIGFIVAGFCVRNLPWHLDDFDQAKQAFTSFEMVEEGHWWFQHTPGGRIATKPPFAGWISAALYGVIRSWDLAWRLPSLLPAIALLALLSRSAHRAAPGFPLAGLMAMGAFGLNLVAPRLATLVRTDMLLTLTIFVAGWLVFEKLRTGAPWTQRDRWALFSTVLISMLTKGPIVYAFLLPGLGGFYFLTRRRGERTAAWSGWWPWALPLFFFALWAGIGISLSEEFYRQVVLKEFLGRFTTGAEAVHKNQPVYFYLTHLLHKFAPWSVLIIGLAFLRNVRAAIWRRPELLWLVCWAAGGFVVMSLVPSKRPDRIFPVIPPLCLLLPAMLAAAGPWRARLGWGVLGVGAVASLGYTAFSVVHAVRTDQGGLVRFGEQVRAAAAQHGWRYGLLGTKDEGLLLYLRRTRFIEDADEQWEHGHLDALVLTEQALKKNGDEFQPFQVSLDSGKIPDKDGRYFLIVRK